MTVVTRILHAAVGALAYVAIAAALFALVCVAILPLSAAWVWTQRGQ